MGCFESKENERPDPTAVRGCTDVFWLIIYVLFWILMIIVAVFSFIYGNPLRIINGYDSFGNTCGVANNEKFADAGKVSGISTLDKPYVFFFDIQHIKKSLKICVNKCPTEKITSPRELYSYYEKTESKYCVYDFNMTTLQTVSKDEMTFHFTGPCPKLPINEESPILHRCVPSGKNALNKEIKELYTLVSSWDILEQAFTDLYKTWHVIVIVCGISLILSIILIGLLHYLTQFISWLICIFVAIASIAITVALWWTYYDLKHNKGTKQLSQLAEIVHNETAVYVFAIIATIVMIILLVVIYLMRSKFAGLAALFEEAGKCMYNIPSLFVPPMIACIALVIFLAFWVTVVICLSTANVPGVKPLLPYAQLQQNDVTPAQFDVSRPLQNTSLINAQDVKKTFKFVEYEDVDWLRHMLWFYIVALIWTTEFIFAAQQLALAGAVAYWYFRKPTDNPVCDSMTKLVKYHLGSIAKGSFLITIFKIPRLILTYFYAKMKAASGKGNDCADCGLKTCICCFWCLEKFIRYLNHNAYTVIAIESINFCPAAGVAWKAIWTHVVSVATINGIGDFVLFLGKLAVAGVCALISLIMLRGHDDVGFIIPVALTTVFSFFIAHVILSLYEIVVDTLFLCVYEDRHINGPTGRWKESNLANLLGEERCEVVEGQMQEVELQPITKQPFASHVFA
ncbi:unnamed protein product [Diamesa serratosioi]